MKRLIGLSTILFLAPLLVLAQEPSESQPPVRISADTLMANCISCPTPAYPVEARAARITDTVVLSVIVGKDGLVTDVRVTRGHQLLREAAMDAARKWKFKPFLINSAPVDVTASVSVSFVFK